MLALIVAVAGVARFAYIGSTEAHFDELWHLELSTGRGSIHGFLPQNVLIPEAPAATSLRGAPPWYEVWTHLSSVTHPPIYPLLLRAWRAAFGESIPVARALSALLSLLCVPLLFEIVRRQFGAGIGLWAALILALSSAQVDQAQEVRNYPLATVFCLGAACTLIATEQSGATTARLIVLGASVFAALLTHYFVAPVIAAMGIYAMIRLRHRERMRAIASIVGGCGLAAIVWGPWFCKQLPFFAYAANDPGGLLDTSEGSRWRTFMRLAGIPVRLLFEPRDRMRAATLFGVVLFVIPWLLVRRRPAMLLWALWLTCAVGFAAVIDLARSSRHLEHLRHTILAGPAVCAILAAAMTGARPIVANGVPLLISLACAAALPMTYTRQNPRYSDIGKALADPATAREPVVFYSDSRIPFWAELMYLGASHYSGTFPRPAAFIHGPPDERLLADLRKSEHLWLVWGATALSSDQIIPGTVADLGQSGDPHLGFVARLHWVNRIPSQR